MADDPPRRVQSADARDLDGLAAKRERERKNAPAEGVPIHAPEDCTPVGHVLALIEQSEIDSAIKRPLKEHVANMALRATQAQSRTDIIRIADELDNVGDAIVDIRGTSGDNGKLGELRRRVDKIESQRWWAATFLAGAVITVISLAVAGGRWVGRIETDVDRLKERYDIRK